MAVVSEQSLKSRSRLSGPLERAARSVVNWAALSGNVSVGRQLRAGLGSSIASQHGLAIGDFANVGRRSVINTSGSIGHFLLVATGVQIIGRNDHDIDQVGVPMSLSTWVGDRPSRPGDTVIIGDDVWIGAGAIVLSGIEIGDGAIIAAGSVVTRSIEPFGIAVGNPARVRRLRFESANDRERHTLDIQLLRNNP